MRERAKSLLGYFNKKYWLVLLLLVAVSYGQILKMTPWQDDQTLFFKLAHLQDRAGYFGYGPIGSGSYKYIVTPYIPVHYLFGFVAQAYYALALGAYLLATLSVYWVFSEVIGKKAGRVAGFIFASGYIASDGFIRLFNSFGTSLSIIIIAFMFLFYWRFYEQRKIKWYLLSLLSFLLVLELVRIRSHYLVSIVFLFEGIFLAFQKPFKSIVSSAVRLVPFSYIFYRYYIVNYDARSAKLGEFIGGLVQGKFYNTYSVVSSFSNLLVTDGLQEIISQFPAPKILLFLFFSAFFVFLFKGRKKPRVWQGLFIAILFSWLLLHTAMFTTAVLNLSETQLLDVYLGGTLLLVCSSIFVSLKRGRQIFLFLVFWILANIGAYGVYQPLVYYESINRLLAHSFFALAGILGFGYEQLIIRKTSWGKFGVSLILLWGSFNLFNSVLYQRKVVANRSDPVKSFYSQLKVYVSSAGKGDVFYFDVASGSRSAFADAFSVASMPEETALAWRYGVDRYDIRRVIDFDTLVDLMREGKFIDINKKDTPIGKIHAFYYSPEGLEETTDELLALLNRGGPQREVDFSISRQGSGFTLEFGKPVVSLVPVELNIKLVADPDSALVRKKGTANKIADDGELRKLAFEYKDHRKNLPNYATVEVSSEWRQNIEVNALDNDISTYWQSDRVLWGQKGEEAVIALDLKSVYEIDKFAWTNAIASSTPSNYVVESSIDGQSWKELSKISRNVRVEKKNIQIVEFQPSKMRFIRMRIQESINGDSPGISEVWVTSTTMSDLDISLAEKYLQNPFGYTLDESAFNETLRLSGYKGKLQASWGSEKILFDVFYDSKVRTYSIILPAGGREIASMGLASLQIPGDLRVVELSYESLSLDEIIN